MTEGGREREREEAELGTKKIWRGAYFSPRSAHAGLALLLLYRGVG
jgi:hypothetical protein